MEKIPVINAGDCPVAPLHGSIREDKEEYYATGDYNSGFRIGTWNYFLRPHGRVFRTEHWVNGYLHGDFQECYPKGIIKISGSYDTGKPIGQWQWYDELGRIMTRGYYPSGLWVFYTIGRLIAQGPMLFDGTKLIQEGSWKYHHAHGNFRNGKQIGIWTWYHQDGKTKKLVHNFDTEYSESYSATGQLLATKTKDLWTFIPL